MDDATWLAAELDADPSACRAAIDFKRRQADERGNPWRNPGHMIRNVITADEWRPLVQQHRPGRPTITLAQCDDSATAHPAHRWTDRHHRNNFHCQGVEEWGDVPEYPPVKRASLMP